jgi:hypothetical protein
MNNSTIVQIHNSTYAFVRVRQSKSQKIVRVYEYDFLFGYLKCDIYASDTRKLLKEPFIEIVRHNGFNPYIILLNHAQRIITTQPIIYYLMLYRVIHAFRCNMKKIESRWAKRLKVIRSTLTLLNVCTDLTTIVLHYL